MVTEGFSSRVLKYKKKVELIFGDSIRSTLKVNLIPPGIQFITNTGSVQTQIQKQENELEVNINKISVQ